MIVIHICRKPLGAANVASNVLEHGTGAMNIDATRIACEGGSPCADRRASGLPAATGPSGSGWRSRTDEDLYMTPRPGEAIGRWPANLILSTEAAGALDAAVPHRPANTGSDFTSAAGRARPLPGDDRGRRGQGMFAQGASPPPWTPPAGEEGGGVSRYFRVVKP
jgi:site-specific DNA-methyltransferase (adenine-specific)